MNIDKTSPEFEAWFKERFWHECYEDVKHHLFAAWQASRESLVIELPNSDDGKKVFPEDYRQAIHAAGVKTK